MKNVFVLAEHRKQQLRETTWEALAAGRDMASALGADLVCILLGNNVDSMAEQLAKECPKVLTVDDPRFETLNSEAFITALPPILSDPCPFLLIMGASNAILDLAPGLSVALDAAFASDCLGLETKDGKILAMRQVYNYKVNATLSFKNADRIVVTLRSGSFPYTLYGSESGVIEKLASPLEGATLKKRFVGYLEAEKGDVDVAAADIIVSVGRGIGDEPDMNVFQSLADTMGGVLACSRPIVDKHLLPKYHQVGTSGVEVKPKIYLALGISGAFQHVGGIKGSPIIVAVNKDPRAPIFRVARYGIVGDVYEVVPALEERIKELKG
jgi:electron transfer flavoprotein alpha subunit